MWQGLMMIGLAPWLWLLLGDKRNRLAAPFLVVWTIFSTVATFMFVSY